MNQLRPLLRRIMYRLKRDYGSPVFIYYEPEDNVNLSTGVRTVTKQRWFVKRGVSLPTEIHRDSVFSSALKPEFRYGQSVQLGDKTLLLDRADLPRDVELGTTNWYMVIDRRRYEVCRVSEYDHRLAYYVVLKELKGAPIDQIVEITVCDRLHVETSADANYPLSRSLTLIDHVSVMGAIHES